MCASWRTFSSAPWRCAAATEIQTGRFAAGAGAPDGARRRPGGKSPLQDYLDRVEREAILEALGTTRFNRTAAAKLLGITFRALRYRMERLGINEPRA